MKVIINAEFGSDFQGEVQKRMLLTMLEAWEDHMKLTHKENNCYIKVEK